MDSDNNLTVKNSDPELSVATITIAPEEGESTQEPKSGAGAKSLGFWLVFISISIATFLSALEFSAVSTVLPTITHDLRGDDFVWVATAYGLAATALLPSTGAIADVFGRKFSVMLWLSLFALGSALCGAAQSMNWLIAGRTVQGAGGGAIIAINSIIVSDLVPLNERALYNTFSISTWAIATTIGPVIGGAFAKPKLWRWLFYMNLPLTGVAMVLVMLFLKVKTPQGSFRDKILKLDWIGNLIIIASSSAVVIALSWGGVRYTWSSAQVLGPLVAGLAGMLLFGFYEAFVATQPLIPFRLIANRTTISGYIQNSLCPMITYTMLYFLPTYFQACFLSSPQRSGVELLGFSAPTGPLMLVVSVVLQATKRYRPVLWAGWAFLLAGLGGMTTLGVDSTLARTVGMTLLVAIGTALIYPATYFPVLAPLPVQESARALALFAFGRQFAGVWGVSIGTAVLQTQLATRLPAAFTAQSTAGVALAYGAIPTIPDLSEPLRTEVRAAFAGALVVLWQVLTGIAGLGLLSSLFMKGMSLHRETDRKWGMKEGEGEKQGVKVDVEKVEKV